MDGFTVSAEPTYYKFTFGSTSYIVREALEGAHVAYKDVTQQAIRMSGDQRAQSATFAAGGSKDDAMLISRCLFRYVEGKEEPISLEEVLGLPRKLTARLLKWIRHNSGMDEDEETIEFLERRIASDTGKLERLKGGHTPGKDGRPTTINTSA